MMMVMVLVKVAVMMFITCIICGSYARSLRL